MTILLVVMGIILSFLFIGPMFARMRDEFGVSERPPRRTLSEMSDRELYEHMKAQERKRLSSEAAKRAALAVRNPTQK